MLSAFKPLLWTPPPNYLTFYIRKNIENVKPGVVVDGVVASVVMVVVSDSVVSWGVVVIDGSARPARLNKSLIEIVMRKQFIHNFSVFTIKVVDWIGCLTSKSMIFQSYMWRHIDVQADWRRKFDLQSGSKRHRHFVGFFNVPVKGTTRWRYGGHILDLSPPGPHGGTLREVSLLANIVLYQCVYALEYFVHKQPNFWELFWPDEFILNMRSITRQRASSLLPT